MHQLLFHDTTPHHVAVDVDPEHDPEGNSERHSNTWPLEATPPKGLLIAEAPTGLGSFRMDLQIGGGGFGTRESHRQRVNPIRAVGGADDTGPLCSPRRAGP